MEDLLFQLFPHLKSEGVRDYDDLSDVEKTTYREMLEFQSSQQLTIEDYKKHIHAMRQSIEYSLASLPNSDEKNTLYKARLLNYLMLEAMFERPERAREMLKQYGKPKLK